MEPIPLVKQTSFNPDAKPFYPSSPPKQIKKESIEIAPALPPLYIAPALSEQKDEPYKPKKYHSICIPRMDADVSKGYIFKVFSRMKIGWIEHIAEVPIKADPQFKRVFIKLKWNRTELANKINVRFDNDQNVKIVHSMPWYWICVSNAYSK
jgi:hypothetical protein